MLNLFRMTKAKKITKMSLYILRFDSKPWSKASAQDILRYFNKTFAVKVLGSCQAHPSIFVLTHLTQHHTLAQSSDIGIACACGRGSDFVSCCVSGCNYFKGHDIQRHSNKGCGSTAGLIFCSFQESKTNNHRLAWTQWKNVPYVGH